MQAENKKSPPQSGPVELVASARGGTKAKYRGHTFTCNGKTSNGSRYHWRCDVRACRARLTTDVFGKEHMVYSSKPHDEQEHRRAESNKKRRRSEATHKQQPSKRIKDCDYVLEKQAGDTQFWRCKFVKCSGRCRTSSDGTVVAGPTLHSAEVHDTRTTTPEGVGTSAAAESNRLASREDDLHESTEATSREALPVQNQESQQERHERKKQLREDAEEEQRKQKQGETSKPSIVLKLVKPLIKSEQSSEVMWEPTPSSAPAAATADGIGHVAAACHGDRHATKQEGDSGKLAADARDPNANCSSSTDRPAAALKQEEADATVDDVYYVDMVSSEDDDAEDAEDKLSHSSVDIECGDAGEDDDKGSQLSADHADENGVYANDDRSHKSAEIVVRDRSQEGSGGYQRRREVLELTRDSRELEQRASILIQMRCLLEAETQLANKRHQVEILRESILERQLKNLVPLTVPSQPDK